MAASTTTGFPAAVSASVEESARAGAIRRRRISPQAGRALEILGHAIEYLADEFAHECASFSADDGRLEAIQMLMSTNRQIYFDCPESPSLRQRFRTFLHAQGK